MRGRRPVCYAGMLYVTHFPRVLKYFIRSQGLISKDLKVVSQVFGVYFQSLSNCCQNHENIGKFLNTSSTTDFSRDGTYVTTLPHIIKLFILYQCLISKDLEVVSHVFRVLFSNDYQTTVRIMKTGRFLNTASTSANLSGDGTYKHFSPCSEMDYYLPVTDFEMYRDD